MVTAACGVMGQNKAMRDEAVSRASKVTQVIFVDLLKEERPPTRQCVCCPTDLFVFKTTEFTDCPPVTVVQLTFSS